MAEPSGGPMGGRRHSSDARHVVAASMFTSDSVHERRLGKEILCNGLAITIGKVSEAIAYSLAHRALDLALLGRRAVPEQLDDVILGPIANPRGPIGRDIRNQLAVGPIWRARQEQLVAKRSQQIARRVAFAAMRERRHQVSATVEWLATTWRRRERPGPKE